MHFDGFLLSYRINCKNFQLKKTEELSLVTLKSDAKIKEKLTYVFKYDMRNLVNFHPTTQKSENVTPMGYFCPKYMRFELKKKRGVISHGTEQWCKIWETLTLWFQNSENCTLMHSFCPKHILFQLETFRGFMCHDTEGCCKVYIRNLVNFYASSWKSKKWHFDWIRLSKVYKYLDEKVQKSYVSWHWRVMQSLKKYWLLVPKMTWKIWWILMEAVASLKIWILMCYFCQTFILYLSHESTEELCFITMKNDTKFE